ncbi:MAG: hypothetical protein ABSC94_06325 [Polyangiaceae bacterium]|jgi:hypothetical protein
MTRYRRRLLAAFALACGPLVGAACSSNETTTGPNGPTDAGSDSTIAEGGADASDSSTSSDAGAHDGGQDADAGDGEAEEATADASDAGEMCTVFDASALDEASVATGLAFIVNTGHCYKCHQSNMNADAALVLSGSDVSIVDGGMVYPPNLTPDPTTGLGCWSDNQIANAILYGIDPADGGLFCVMPTFGLPKTLADGAVMQPLLTDASVGSVVDFLRSLAPVSNQVQNTVCPSPASADAGDAAPADAAGGDAADASDGGEQ